MDRSTTRLAADTFEPMRLVRLWLAFSLALAGCAAREPGVEAEAEGLTVCHTTVVEGIDVAEFQGAVDWNQVHASGREFGIARIGDGNHLDPTFDANWNGIRAAGMVRRAYYFFRPTLDAATQAQHVSDAVGVLGDGDLPVTIDVECMCPFSTPGHTCVVGGAGCATASEAAAVLMDLVSRVRALTGKQPMIYTSARVWDGASYMASTASEPESPLWVPGYTHGCVAVASSWSDWHFWQYSDGTCRGCVSGVVPGVASGADVDRDQWNGTLAELRAFATAPRPDAGVDGGLAADAGGGGDAGEDAGVPRDGAVVGDATHVDIVLPGDGSVSPVSRAGGCGCGVAGTRAGTPWCLVFLALLASGRVFERRARRAAEQELAQRFDVA